MTMLHTAYPTPRSPTPFPELYKRVERHIPPFEWSILAADIAAILKLKEERNAVVLAHNYQTPDIFHTVGDIVGDSLALAREAARTDADVIVLAGVHFMAETAKLLNPAKTVLIPDLEAGCDFTGSTAAMADYVGKERPARVVLLTECSMSDNVALQYPDLEFVRPCNLCPHMKRITLPKIRHSLETMTHEVTVDPAIAERARRTVERMMALG